MRGEGTHTRRRSDLDITSCVIEVTADFAIAATTARDRQRHHRHREHANAITRLYNHELLRLQKSQTDGRSTKYSDSCRTLDGRARDEYTGAAVSQVLRDVPVTHLFRVRDPANLCGMQLKKCAANEIGHTGHLRAYRKRPI
jgi:hypothetical protein